MKRTLQLIFLAVLVFANRSPLFAQWVQTNGPYGATVISLAVSGTSLFAGTSSGGVFLSTNNGTTWTGVNSGLTNSVVRSLAVLGTSLFAGTNGGVFLSTNNGTTWTAVNSGLTNSFVRSLAVSGTSLFAGTSGGGVFLSTNNGTTWTAVKSGLTNTYVNSLAVSGTNLFAGTEGGVFLSINNGTTWSAVNSGLTNFFVRSLTVSGTNLFAGTDGGVFLSTNNGTSWTAVNSGLTNTSVYALAVSGTNLFAGTWGGGVFLSTNNGTSWTAVNSGLTNFFVRSLAVSGTNLFAGTFGGGVFLSTNNGMSWTAGNSGLTITYVEALADSGTSLFAGTSGGGVFLSTNSGTTWTAVNSGLTNFFVRSLALSGTNLFAGTDGGVFLSTNNGTSWTAVNSGLTNSVVRSLAVSGMNLFAGTSGGGVFLSTNNGTTWTAVNSGLTNTSVEAIAVSGTSLFAGTSGGGIFLSTNNGTSWTAVNSGLTNTSVEAIAVSGTSLFAGTSGGGVFLTTNSGTTWTAVNSGLTNFFLRSLAVSGTNLFAGTDGGVFLSTNNGTSWTEGNSGLTNTFVYALAVSGTNLFAGTYGRGVWRRPLSEMINFQTASDYYLPLQVGSYLQFYTEGNNVGWSARTTKLSIDGIDTISGEVYFRELGTENDIYGLDTFRVSWLRKDQTGNICVGAFSDKSTNIDSAFIIDPALPYFTNQHLAPGFVLASEWGTDSVMSVSVSVQVPAGSFTNCIQVRNTSFDDSGEVHIIEINYYAKNVGIVKTVREFPEHQVHTSNLTEYGINRVDALKKYVAIGDGITAGFQSNALFESAQQYSVPKLIAEQLKIAGAPLGNFEQPIYSDPGSPDPISGLAARNEILSLIPLAVGPKGLAPGTATNTALPRPYDNMGIQGSMISDLLDTADIVTRSTLYKYPADFSQGKRGLPFFLHVMRNQTIYGKRIIDQVKKLHTVEAPVGLITFGLGSNSIMYFASGGGLQMFTGTVGNNDGSSQFLPITPVSVFTSSYSDALDSLQKNFPGVKIIVTNIPDFSALPFFTHLGPKVVAAFPAGVYLRYQKSGVTGPSIDSTRFSDSEIPPPYMTLRGYPYAVLIGAPGGKWYRDNNLTVPAGIDTTKPFGVHPQNPWPDALILHSAEQSTAQTALTGFNAAIETQAAKRGIPVVDIYGFMNNLKTNGLTANGLTFTTDFVSGGFFSLDGLHPSSRGAGIVANEFIKKMNIMYGYTIPLIDVSVIPGIPGVTSAENSTVEIFPPKDFKLHQNYPNPFNPSTTIRYGLPNASYVKLRIYNILGQQIADLVNTEQSAGWYETVWSGDAVSSGLYFYRIDAENASDPNQRFTKLKKMLLLK